MAVLGRPEQQCRWYLALADDACLQPVPGSHRRPGT